MYAALGTLIWWGNGIKMFYINNVQGSLISHPLYGPFWFTYIPLENETTGVICIFAI